MLPSSGISAGTALAFRSPAKRRAKGSADAGTDVGQAARDLELRVEDVELRAELQREFTAVRTEMREGFSRVDRELAEVRQEAGDFRSEVRGEFKTAHARMDGIESAMRVGFEQARQLTLVLHEQLRSDIRALGEGLPPRKGESEQR